MIRFNLLENLCVSSELKKVTTGNVTSALNTQKSALDVFYDKLALVLKDDAEVNPSHSSNTYNLHV